MTVDLEAERTLLGVLLVNPAVIDQVSDQLRPSHFAAALHARAFTSLQSMRDESAEINLATLKHRLSADVPLAREDVQALAGWVDGIPHVTDGQHWAQRIRNAAKTRALIAACTKAIDAANAETDADDLLSSHHAAVERLLESGDGKHTHHIREALMRAQEDLDKYTQSSDGITGIPTGLRSVDDLTGGLQRGSLFVIAARPRRGKSVFCAQSGRFAAGKGFKVLAFSMEMPPHKVAQRIVLAEASVERYQLRTSGAEAAWKRIATALPQLTDLPFWFDSRESPTISQIGATARRVKASHGLDLLVVDYIQRCGLDRKQDRWAAIGDLMRGLKSLALNLNVAVLAAAQVGRRGEDERPTLGMLREAGDIENEADVVAFLHPADGIKAEQFLQMDVQPIDLIVEKNREGAGDNLPLNLERRFTRFSERNESADWKAKEWSA